MRAKQISFSVTAFYLVGVMSNAASAGVTAYTTRVNTPTSTPSSTGSASSASAPAASANSAQPTASSATASGQVPGAEASQSAPNQKTNGPVTTTPPIPNANDNYLGDTLSWDSPIVVQAVGKNRQVDLSHGYCLPANVRVVGTASGFSTATVKPADDSSTGTSTNYLPAILNTDRLLGVLPAQKSDDVTVDPKTSQISVTGDTQVKVQQLTNMCQDLDFKSGPAITIAEGTEFYVSQDDLENAAIRAGWDYGTLVVPFKIQLTKAHAFAGSSTIGAYLGYRLPIHALGFQLTPVIFAGASNIATSETTGGATNSQTVAGLTYGFGLIGTIKDSFHMGIVLGADHVDTAQPYLYNDRPWLSFEIGYSFSQ